MFFRYFRVLGEGGTRPSIDTPPPPREGFLYFTSKFLGSSPTLFLI